jgi:CheY-like chemotaxis protein
MKQKHILIIDDDADFVLALRMILEGEGYRVEEASNGAEGLAKMREHLPALVFMDVMMANPLDGYYTTQEISEDPQLRNVPILMLSSIADTPHAASFPTDQYVHIVEFISKPIEPDHIVAKVKGWLKS